MAKKKKTSAKKKKTSRQDFYLLLDRSGSMAFIATDVVGGVNTFIKDNQALTVGDMNFTLVQFDTQDPFEVIYDGVPIADVKEFTAAQFTPRGGTPLYDGIGKLVARAKTDLTDITSDVVVVIVTDGYENASREWNQSAVKTLVADQEKLGWTFVFIGANQDAALSASGVGSTMGSSLNFAQTPDGTRDAFATLTMSNTTYRGARAGGQAIASNAYLVDKS